MIFMFSLYEMQHVMEARKVELNQQMEKVSYARQANVNKDKMRLLELMKKVFNICTKSRQAECCA